MTIRLLISVMLVGLMLFGAEVASADSHGGGSGGTTATSTDPGTNATTTDPGTGDGSDGTNATSTNPGTNATTTASIADGDGDGEGKGKAFVGVVSAIDKTEFTLIQNGTGDAVDIYLYGYDTANLKTPGGGRARTFAVGARVVIKARWVDSEWVAVTGLVKPAPPRALTGIVVAVQDGVVTVMRHNGKTQSMQLSPEAEVPAVGDVATILEGLVYDGTEVGGLPLGSAVVKATKVRQRLELMLKEISESNGDLTEEKARGKAKQAQRLAQLLAGHGVGELQLIDTALEGASPEDQSAFQNAKDKTQAAIARAEAKAQAAVERSQAKVQAAIERDETKAQAATDRADAKANGTGNGPKSGGVDSGDAGDDEPTDGDQGQGQKGPPENKPGRGNQAK